MSITYIESLNLKDLNLRKRIFSNKYYQQKVFFSLHKVVVLVSDSTKFMQDERVVGR